MPWISVPVKELKGTDQVKCVSCGRRLDTQEIEETKASDTWPSCDHCWPDVHAVREEGSSMWPSGWYGHAWQDNENHWHTEIVRP